MGSRLFCKYFEVSFYSAAACVLFSASLAMAGAWDVGPFDNDDALDWVWELSESDDLSVIENALNDATRSSGYLEAPTGSIAIAAAEVVAALKGKPRPQLPAEVADWVRQHQFNVPSGLVELTQSAVAAVRDAETSELAQLWSDSDELLKLWDTNLKDLLRRLEQ